MIKIKLYLVTTIILLSTVLIAQSNQAEINMAKQIAGVFVTNHFQSKNKIDETNIITLFNNENNLSNTYLFNLLPKGFVIVSPSSNNNPILAYSSENNFAQLNTQEGDISLNIIKKIIIGDSYNSQNSSKNVKDVIYGPYVHTMWGQVNCFDDNGQLVNVSNIYTPNHYAPGCVAVSQSTIMSFYSWPPRGTGAHAYSDNSGSSRGYYAANYFDSEYHWDTMLERYRAKPSTSSERKAVGDVVFDVAISLFMDFEPDGATSNVNRIPTSFANYFRFTSLYRDKNTSGFWTLLDSNMVRKKPAVLAVSGSPGGHSVVCDGLKIENNQYSYHLNMGWWGVSNGWYNIRNGFNAGGYSVIDGAAMNIIPEPYLLTPVVSPDSATTKLCWMYPQNAEAQAFQLQVSIDGGDWQTMSDNIIDTNYNLAPNISKSYKYRVRAKVNGFWYNNSWSNTAYLHVDYSSINEDVSSLVAIYPIPFGSKLNIKPKKNGIINIYSISGNKFFSSEIVDINSEMILDTQKWPKGIYIVKITYDDRVFSKKIVKI